MTPDNSVLVHNPRPACAFCGVRERRPQDEYCNICDPAPAGRARGCKPTSRAYAYLLLSAPDVPTRLRGALLIWIRAALTGVVFALVLISVILAMVVIADAL